MRCYGLEDQSYVFRKKHVQIMYKTVGSERNEVLTIELWIRVLGFLKEEDAHAKSVSLPVVAWG